MMKRGRKDRNKYRAGAGKVSGSSSATNKSGVEKFPHFRKYNKTNHPALIVGEQVNESRQEEYQYRKVMHSEKDGRHLNERVYPNPDPKDPKPMHIAKRTRRDVKKNFSKWKYPWQYF